METEGIAGVCYPIEEEEEFKKWKSNYETDLAKTNLLKKKSHKRK